MLTHDGSQERKGVLLRIEMLNLTCGASQYIVYSGKKKEKKKPADNSVNILYFALLSTVYVFGSARRGASVAALFSA